MIAPIRPYVEEETDVGMQEARRAAAALLTRENSASQTGSPVPAWQAWLLLGWMAITAAAFLSIMLDSYKDRA